MTGRLRAFVFDFDGTIAETERDGHRVAYNAAFERLELPWRWEVDAYGELLRIAGGKERLAAFIGRERPDMPATEIAALAARIHEEKRRAFGAIAPALVLRPGIERLVAEAHAAGTILAIATTAARDGVDAVLQRFPAVADAFATIAAGDEVPRKKPAPDIYLLALERIGCAPHEALAFEDSALGVAAARAAGMPVLVTPSVYTAHESFAEARAVLGDLGEPDRPSRVIAGPAPARGFVDVAYATGLTLSG